jgi:hypothetical protein
MKERRIDHVIGYVDECCLLLLERENLLKKRCLNDCSLDSCCSKSIGLML